MIYMKNNLTVTILIAIVVGALAFFAGMKYQQSTGSAQSNGISQGQGGQRFGGGRSGGNGGPIVGKILSQDSSSITIQLQDGSSKIVNVSSTTTISKTTKAAQSDLTVGTQVAAFGTTNSDGSITAQTVQINPMFRMRGPRPTQGQ
jgi:hypothetical protein